MLALSVTIVASAQEIPEYTGLKAGDKCHDYVFLDKGSYYVFLSQLGRKFIYIDVWATWCQPCKDEFPALKELKKEFADDNIVFLQISCDTGRYKQWWQQNVKQYELTEPQWALSAADGFMNGFQVTYIPRFILIGPDGKIIDERMTPPSDPQTRVRLRELLDAAPAILPGIDFLDISFDDALIKAEQEGKPIFIDAYTSWCGPCREMDYKILSEPEVYNFMNENFVNLKIDMEKGEGPQVAQRYGINSYPTYLLVKPDAALQYKFTGMTRSTGEFLDKIKEGLNSKGWIDEAQAVTPEPVIEPGSYAAYDKQLTDILQRRDRSATIKASDLPEKELLYDYATLVSVHMRRDGKVMMDYLEKMAPRWDNDQLNSRFFGVASEVVSSGNNAHRDRLVTLIDRMLEREDLTYAARSLEFFLDGVIRKK